MEFVEMKMLRFAMGVTRRDGNGNECIGSTVGVERLGMEMREGRLRWCGLVMGRDREYLGGRIMGMELPKRRKRGRPRRGFLDLVNGDMGEVGARETDVEDRMVWRRMIRCGYP